GRSDGSRAHPLELLHAVGEEIVPVFVVDLLAQERLGARAGELTGVLGQLMAGALQLVVDFVAGGGEDLLRLRFSRGDQLALLALALRLGTLANGAQLVFDLPEARLDVGRQLVGFLAACASLVGRAANARLTGPPIRYPSTPRNTNMFASLRIQPGMPK